MKTTIYLMTFFFILISCSIDDSENNWTEIKLSNSIEKYQNYLIEYPQTRHLSEIRDSLKIFWKKFYIENSDFDCYGNCLLLMINKKGQLLFGGELIKKSNLKERVKYAIKNPDNLPNLPDKKWVEIEKLGVFFVSRGVIDIVTNNELGNKSYSEIIMLVKNSFIEMQNEFSMNLYNKGIKKLNNEQKRNIETIIPINIRFERYFADPTELPPLPPSDSVQIELEQIEENE